MVSTQPRYNTMSHNPTILGAYDPSLNKSIDHILKHGIHLKGIDKCKSLTKIGDHVYQVNFEGGFRKWLHATLDNIVTSGGPIKDGVRYAMGLLVAKLAAAAPV